MFIIYLYLFFKFYEILFENHMLYESHLNKDYYYYYYYDYYNAVYEGHFPF